MYQGYTNFYIFSYEGFNKKKSTYERLLHVILSFFNHNFRTVYNKFKITIKTRPKSMTIIQQLGMFSLGLRDSISLQFIKKTLLYVDPQTKKVHPSSKTLFDSLKSSIVKILLYVVIVPKLLQLIDIIGISVVLRVIYLVITYGYLFFQNNDILVATRKLMAWQEKRTPGQGFELDKTEKIEFFTQLSAQIKGFIFLVFYYVPILLIQLNVLSHVPFIGTFLLILSQSFFNGVFYFMKTWPFDKYNIGFMERNMSYMVGYGFTVSVVCNLVLAGSYATGAYLILSLWMLINSVIYSPPEVKFTSLQDVLRVVTKENQRNRLKNAYNSHRLKLRKQPIYREEVVRGICVVYPALKITQALNRKFSRMIQTQTLTNEQEGERKFPSVITEVEEEKEEENSEGLQGKNH